MKKMHKYILEDIIIQDLESFLESFMSDESIMQDIESNQSYVVKHLVNMHKHILEDRIRQDIQSKRGNRDSITSEDDMKRRNISECPYCEKIFLTSHICQNTWEICIGTS